MAYEGNHLIIVGGVAAGMKAAAKARRESPAMKITVVTDEEYISYAGFYITRFKDRNGV